MIRGVFTGLLGMAALMSDALRATAHFIPWAAPRRKRTRSPNRETHGRRLESRIRGGNWQGKEYLSYSEHDFCKRMAMTHGEKQKGRHAPLYERAREILFSERAKERAAS